MYLPLLARTAAIATAIFIPLYGYPGDAPDCANWDVLWETLECFPGLPFVVVINPATGPGAVVGSQPDTNVQSCVAQVKSHPNAEVLGYVATGYGAQDDYYGSDFVLNNITTYWGWDEAYQPHGIFFDQVPTEAGSLSLYTTYADLARTNFTGNSGALGITRTVMLNPGSAPDSGYFDIADLIITEEEAYDSFDPSQLTIGPSTPAQKQVVCIHDAPADYGNTTTWYYELVAQDNIAALMITDVPYTEISTELPFLSFVVSLEDGLGLGVSPPYASDYLSPSCPSQPS